MPGSSEALTQAKRKLSQPDAVTHTPDCARSPATPGVLLVMAGKTAKSTSSYLGVEAIYTRASLYAGHCIHADHTLGHCKGSTATCELVCEADDCTRCAAAHRVRLQQDQGVLQACNASLLRRHHGPFSSNWVGAGQVVQGRGRGSAKQHRCSLGRRCQICIAGTVKTLSYADRRSPIADRRSPTAAR